MNYTLPYTVSLAEDKTILYKLQKMDEKWNW